MGLSQGFRVGVISPPSATDVDKNLQSAVKEPDVVSRLLEHELNKGYVTGSFQSWILLNRVRVLSVLHLLDDFLLLDPPHDSSGSLLSKLKHCFQALDIPLSDEKTPAPATRLEFLGIMLDSVEMKASLPVEKL